MRNLSVCCVAGEEKAPCHSEKLCLFADYRSEILLQVCREMMLGQSFQRPLPANQRLFRLKEKIPARYEGVSGADLTARVMGTASQAPLLLPVPVEVVERSLLLSPSCSLRRPKFWNSWQFRGRKYRRPPSGHPQLGLPRPRRCNAPLGSLGRTDCPERPWPGESGLKPRPTPLRTSRHPQTGRHRFQQDEEISHDGFD